jgi:hypothetical protein
MPTWKAYNSFTQSLKLAERLLELERKSYDNPPKKSHREIVEGLRGGAAVLMVASFEFFLRELAIEAIDSISGPVHGIAFDKLPDDMRVTAIFESLNLSMKGPRHGPSIPRRDRIQDVLRNCTAILAGNLDPEAFSDTGSNPGPKIVVALFKNFGITEVLTKVKEDFESSRHWGKPVSATFIQDKLDSIVRNRNVVAHTARALDFSRTDLKDSLKFLRVLGSVLGLAMHKHLEQVRQNASSP